MKRKHWLMFAILYLGLIASGTLRAQDQPAKLKIDWSRTVRVSQTTPTLQVVVNPPLRRGTSVHDNAYKALHDLGADYVRYVPWLPYPRLGIPELEPPANGKTSWDFSLIDPMTIDFLEATKNHPVILNFSTIPQWMFKGVENKYPDDPNQVVWEYTKGLDFRDPTFKEAAQYYARLISWYTQGGFTDEFGKRHESGHHYRITHWEVLNEPELERNIPPEVYTKFYDAVVTEMHKASPDTKFVGMALAAPSTPAVAITGDGGFNMMLGELETARRAGIGLTIVVVNNAASGYVKALQHAMFRGRYQSSDLVEMDYAAIARTMGCNGIRVEDPERLGEALRTGLTDRTRPTVLDVVVTRDPARMLPAVDNRTVEIRQGDRVA